MVLKNKLLRQASRFGLVGMLAAAVHFSMVVFFVETSGLQPLVANVFAFLIAFQVSYWGHRYWTFEGTITLHRVALPKLLFVNSLVFMANEVLYFFFLSTFHLPYALALFLVLTILPLVSFTLSKSWIFR